MPQLLSDICEYGRKKVPTERLNCKTYISTENMLPDKGGIVDASSLPTTPQAQAFSCGDTLVSNIRPYFKKIWQATFDGGCSNDVLVFTPKEGVDPTFLYYLLADDNFFAYSMATSKGTKMPRGDKKAIMQYAVPDIPITEQKIIGGILRSIDKKIEVNKAINDNLQQQLCALFVERFTNNPALDSMQQIPLSELCVVVTKGTTPTTLGRAFVDNGINFLKAESIQDNHAIDKGKFSHIDEDTHELLKRSILQDGDIVFTIAGTLGRFALIDSDILPANTNQAVAIIRADRKKISPEYIYSCFLGNWHNDYYAKRIQQAVQANLSLTTIKSLPIPVMEPTAMNEYMETIVPIVKLIKQNEIENERLASVRDILLPRLMSGEIDVSDVQI